jgi:hypothetical protein
LEIKVNLQNKKPSRLSSSRVLGNKVIGYNLLSKTPSVILNRC